MKIYQLEVNVDDVSSCLCTIYNNGKANVLIIDNVFTDPNFRNKGYGKKLIKKVIDKAKELNIDSVELLVNSDNIIAKSLYERFGFEKTNKEHQRLILNKL